ncbi:MAG: molybdenum cofactor biosynthesis protein MoaE [Gemmatimonadota bacterium]|jgi:molybdopterin synthase catalytic subunit
MKTGIVTDPIEPEDVLRGLGTPKDGAQLLFLGVVRDHSQGRVVTGLDYEVYESMAERTLSQIASEASHRFGTDRISVLHRVGELQVGEVSTAIGVAAHHRGEAYDASRYIIEELKQRLPIWKREHFAEGDAEWVGARNEGPP